MSDNSFGISVAGGGYGGAFGGLGISNFTVMAVGVVLLAGLAGHMLLRRNARDELNGHAVQARAQQNWDAMPEEHKRRMKLHHGGHEAPTTYDEAANDVYAFTCSVTLPDVAMQNHDRIKESVHRRHSRIQRIIDSMTEGQYSEGQGHQQLHGMSQEIMNELKLPHRESVNLMPYTISNIE